MDTPKNIRLIRSVGSVPARILEVLREGCVYECDNYSLYVVNSDDLIKLTKDGYIHRWSKNRPEDLKRVKEITEEYKKTNVVLGTLFFAFLAEEGGLVCYDGNHRRVALIPGIKGVTINVMWRTTQDMIIEQFNAINKAISVPLIYLKTINNENDGIRLAILEFVTDLVSKYDKFSSGSKVCARPNFNRDVLVDDLSELHAEYSKYSINELLMMITLLNTYYEKRKCGFNIKMDNLKETQPKMYEKLYEKCSKSGLWLFWSSRKIDQAYLKKCLHILKKDLNLI